MDKKIVIIGAGPTGLGAAYRLKRSSFSLSKIASTFFLECEYAYPIPTLQRKHCLKKILPYLEARGVYSRGRFGARRYEIGNMDHSVLQGIEVAERILEGKDEGVLNSVSKR